MKTRSITLLAAISVNGKIADQKGDFLKFSSPEDRKWLHQKIKDAEVLIMGRKTFDQHVRSVGKKPIIVFTRGIKGVKASSPGCTKVYFFHDTKKDLIEYLDLLQLRRVCVLGGAEIYHWFLKEKLVTDIFLTLEPVIIDGGKNFLSGTLLSGASSWKLRSVKKLNILGSLLIHYQP